MRRISAAAILRRLIPRVRYGTEGYPDKIARRLRATNIVTWFASATTALFAAWRFADGSPHWKFTALASIVFGSIPILHRFGALAAPFALVAIAYTWIFWITSYVGTDSGATYFYFTAAALGILLVGGENVLLSVLIGSVAAGAMIFLHSVIPRDTGRISGALDGSSIGNIIGSSVLLYVIVFYAVRQFTLAEDRADHERIRSESLLLNILPPQIAERLKDTPNQTIADAHPAASILFADMADFTARASDTTPEELVGFLNEVHRKLDAIVERHGLEKIKSAGDAYMVVSGVPESACDHAGAIANLALDIRDSLVGLTDPKGRTVPVRIGIASGPVVAGVIGTRKLFYDVWGDAVNTASRMESTGEPGKIQISSATHTLLKGRFALQERGFVEIRGKGPMQTWFLTGRL